MTVHVLAVVKGLGPGGAEHLLVTEAKTFDRDVVCFDVAYVLPGHGELVEALHEQGIVVRCLGGRAGVADLRWLWRLRRLLASDGYDVVHLHSPLIAAAARLLARTVPAAHRPAVVSTEHNTWSSHHRLTALVNRATFRLGDAWLAVSEAVRTSLPRSLRPRVEVLVHGIVLGDFAESDARSPARQALGLADDDVMILTVANLRRTKGYPDLLTAAAGVVAAEPRARFFAVGQGPLEHELRTKADRLGLDGSFTFLGFRRDVRDLLAAADLFAMSSHHEGYPIAVMEAMAAGLPVVATTVGGIPDAVADEQQGILVPPGRPEALAEAILELVRDPGRRQAMARSAREVSDRYDIRTAARRMEAIYKAVSARR
jgi:glycosyltransferase involved in cell wall biosynthesis